MTIAYHLVARTRPGFRPLESREHCADIWQRLRSRFGRIAACVLMPNHLHLLLLATRLEAAKWRLGVELRAWSRSFFPGQSIWTRMPEPEAVPDEAYLKRLIRYIHLNPCRAGLAADPLEWEWSTHRDVTGLVADPWPDLAQVSRLFRVGSPNLSRTIHEYVSSDPSVSIDGTPSPLGLKPGQLLLVEPSQALVAAAMVLRERLPVQRGQARDLAIHALDRLRIYPSPTELGFSRFTWRRALSRKPTEQSLQAILKVLSDPRSQKALVLHSKGVTAPIRSIKKL